MSDNPNPPKVGSEQVVKTWQFIQNPDGSLSPSGGSGVSDVNIKDISGSPPALSNPLPVELSDGTQAVGTPTNPISVNVITGGGTNASVGSIGSTAPTSATEVGGINDANGSLAPVHLDRNGSLKVVSGRAVDVTVFQEILMELRAMRRLLCLLYEESGQGDPTNDLFKI